jgi:hypothetical protein
VEIIDWPGRQPAQFAKACLFFYGPKRDFAHCEKFGVKRRAKLLLHSLQPRRRLEQKLAAS